MPVLGHPYRVRGKAHLAPSETISLVVGKGVGREKIHKVYLEPQILSPLPGK